MAGVLRVEDCSACMASGLSTLKEDQIAERGARLARREERAYWAYVSDEQRRQTGCPAREVVLLQRGQATSRELSRIHPMVPSLIVDRICETGDPTRRCPGEPPNPSSGTRLDNQAGYRVTRKDE